MASELAGIGCDVRRLDLPGVPEKGDLSDAIDAGMACDEFAALIDAAPPWQPSEHADETEVIDDATPARIFTARALQAWISLRNDGRSPASCRGLRCGRHG